MADTAKKKEKKNICLAVLAHVDSGKTTLSEAMLYQTGTIRKLGRVDHRNTFLDTDELERARGITIFSKQAQMETANFKVTLLDTPGHADFSSEMERTLSVIDAGLLVINGADGVQEHTKTLWRLLERYNVPVFIFVNKMDQPTADYNTLMANIRAKLDRYCVDFKYVHTQNGLLTAPEEILESIVSCDETLLEHYLEEGKVEKESVRQAIAERKLFPCIFGSALKLEGVTEFVEMLDEYLTEPKFPEQFGAKVFKIGRDSAGNRISYVRMTGGVLKVKSVLEYKDAEAEKVDQIRIYSGENYKNVTEAVAGEVCVIAGLKNTYTGMGLGIEADAVSPVLQPVLSYKLELPALCDKSVMLKNLRQLEEENPLLRVTWNERFAEIHVQIMGDIESEVLKSRIKERFGVDVGFSKGSIVYRETISDKNIGVGHFEPLKHYAEVQLLLEPGERGSGLQFETVCSTDELDRNWQRLILTHLAEKKHVGVLTGSEITDIKITLLTGRAHNKHTEGGDFRQATYRAVRQGLMKADSVLLEPYYEFTLEIPQSAIGRALNDLQKLNAEFSSPDIEEENAIITGRAPVACLQGYQREVTAYTKGSGRLVCSFCGYDKCHNAEEVVQSMGYDAESDLDNPASSVFCSQGTGFTVEWYDADRFMHTEPKVDIPMKVFAFAEQYSAGENGEILYKSGLEENVQNNVRSCSDKAKAVKSKSIAPGDMLRKDDVSSMMYTDNELKSIFERTYGTKDKSRENVHARVIKAPKDTVSQKAENAAENTYMPPKHAKNKEKYLLVDGYNIIFAWEELNELSKTNLNAARHQLMDILSNYQGYKKMNLILVFDAYKVPGNPGEYIKYNNINVVYTKEAETADYYIEKLVNKIGFKYDVTVATSDGLEQLIIWGDGAKRLSASGLKQEIENTNNEIREILNKTK